MRQIIIIIHTHTHIHMHKQTVHTQTTRHVHTKKAQYPCVCMYIPRRDVLRVCRENFNSLKVFSFRYFSSFFSSSVSFALSSSPFSSSFVPLFLLILLG